MPLFPHVLLDILIFYILDEHTDLQKSQITTGQGAGQEFEWIHSDV